MKTKDGEFGVNQGWEEVESLTVVVVSSPVLGPHYRGTVEQKDKPYERRLTRGGKWLKCIWIGKD